MHTAPPAMSRSPRQAPGGASPSPLASATATPPTAIATPAPLRTLSFSMPSSAAIAMVSSGMAESASAPRAAVV